MILEEILADETVRVTKTVIVWIIYNFSHNKDSSFTIRQ